MRYSPTRRPIGLERLEDRAVPATLAVLSGGVLFVQGTAAAKAIFVSRDAAGAIHVTDAAGPVDFLGGPTPTVFVGVGPIP